MGRSYPLGVNKHSWRLYLGFGLSFSPVEEGFIYGYISVGVIKKCTSFQINRDNFTEQYKTALAKYVVFQGWPHAPLSWREPPDFDEVLRRCKTREVPHSYHEDKLMFELI